MNGEISLKELIQDIWNNKAIVASIILVCLIAGVIYSFFIEKPIYEATSIIRFIQSESDSGDTLASLKEIANSATLINSVLERLDLGKEGYTIDNLRNNVQAEIVNEASLMKLTVQGEQNKVTEIANQLAFEIIARKEISDRSALVIRTENKIRELIGSVEKTLAELSELQVLIESTPKTVQTKKTLIDDTFMYNAGQELDGIGIENASNFSYLSEEPNPLFLTLENKISEAKLKYTDVETQIKLLEKEIQMHNESIEKLDNRLKSDHLLSNKTVRILNDNHVSFVTPAIGSGFKIGTGKMLQLAIALLVGIFLSAIIVMTKKSMSNLMEENNQGDKK